MALSKTKNFSVKQRLVSISVVNILVAMILSGISYMAIHYVALYKDEALTSTRSLLLHTQVDVRMDALRTGVLHALRVAEFNDPEKKKGVRVDVQSNIKGLRDSFNQDVEMALVPQVRASLVEIGPLIESVITATQRQVELSLSDRVTGAAQYDDYVRGFETLEGKMDATRGLMRGIVTNDQAAATSVTNLAFTSILGVLGGGLIVLIVLASVVIRAVITPLASITAAVKRLGVGDLAVEIPTDTRAREIAEIASALEVFKSNKIEADRLVEEQRKDNETRALRTRRIEDMCATFDTSTAGAVRSVAATATQLQTSSASMSVIAEETTLQGSEVATASEQASANVQAVSAAANELLNSITEIGGEVDQTTKIASTAVSEAKLTNAKVQGLAQAVGKIGEVVALITDIAEQTNLLALNATIEAARAGDAGKGFAVVASEVKNLANQTARATDEIGTQISGIQTATQEAVEAIENIGNTITKINDVASNVASAVDEQGMATQEIARNAEQAADGTQKVSFNIAAVTRAAGETGSASVQIQAAADELSQHAEMLRTEMDNFLSGIRA